MGFVKIDGLAATVLIYRFIQEDTMMGLAILGALIYLFVGDMAIALVGPRYHTRGRYRTYSLLDACEVRARNPVLTAFAAIVYYGLWPFTVAVERVRRSTRERLLAEDRRACPLLND